jgi:hypothetical protein
MTADTWLENNNQYLAASLAWLRLRLLQGVSANGEASGATPLTPDHGVEGPAGFFRRWRKGNDAPARGATLSLPPASVARATIESAMADREAKAAFDPPPALTLLEQRLGLSAFERDILLLCVAMELDPALSDICARLHGLATRAYPTFGLALSMLADASWEALSAHRPLRHLHLIEISQPGATPLTASPLRADERVVNFLKGLNALDDRLASLLTGVEAGNADDVSPSQQAGVDAIMRELRASTPESPLPVVQLQGPDIGSKLAVARRVCATLGRHLYRISADTMPNQASEIETFARLWQRETILVPVCLYIDAENIDSLTSEGRAALHRFLSREVGLIFLGVREAPVKLQDRIIAISVDRPTPAEQRQVWSELLSNHEPPPDRHRIAELIAGQFNLNFQEIRQIADRASQEPPVDGETLGNRVWQLCRENTHPQLDSLAQRLDAKGTWEDLVLPAEQMNIMRQIAAQVRERHRVYREWGFAARMNRGLGITALFSGESGTGKTLAAEVIANDLQLDLYRIDLSAVVSKYIGETEKNLRKLFDAAERGGAILFFDEADALFGKRGEVKDSHDRYANIEINYLLQRMEAFSGLAILATNMKNALDTAFMRRLRFIVQFQFPGLKERKSIWQKALPPQTPVDALDYDRLARLSITGGNIHSIALNAAFLAAESGQPVNMPILLAATRTEMRKLEKPFSEGDLR